VASTSRKVTLNDVATMAGVSKSTASRILNAAEEDRPPFDPETQQRVRRAVELLGYVPSKLAQGLTKAKTQTIGLIVPSIEDSFFPEVTSIIETRLAQHGYTILLANSQGKAETERTKIENLLAWRVDGLMIVPCQEGPDAALYWDLWRNKLPFVLIDRRFVDTPFDCVTTDDYAGAAAVIEHLVGLGRKRIARVGGASTIYTVRLRDQGCRETLARYGLDIDPHWMIEAPSSYEGGRAAIRQLVGAGPLPDAVFCFSDLVAMGVLEECLSRGIRVPHDLALVGYADLDYAKMLRVPLTTVHQPRELLGRTAADMLLSRLAGEPPQTHQPILPVELVVRDSTRAAS
jgi:LacI family transcriptional regulator